LSNNKGYSNTAIGFNANFSAPDLFNSTAIGNGAIVSQNNSIVLGNGIVNVGIGTSAPAATLHVVGDGLITGNLTVNGTITGNVNATFGPGNPNYIQNTTTQQATSNFNISGNGAANIFDALTQFNIGGNRILSNGGTGNLFAGVSVGALNTGTDNSFFGASAGETNADGANNSFFGSKAGRLNTSGNHNSFFGNSAGLRNSIQILNTFIGYQAGSLNGSGDTVGTANANTFVGASAGDANRTGGSNTAIGNQADVGSAGLFNTTAIGANAFVTRSNSVVLGSIQGTNGASGDTNVGIGITAPSHKLDVLDTSNTGLRVETNSSGGTVGSFGFFGDFQIDSTAAFGGRFAVLENGNVGIGNPNPGDKLNVNGNVSLFLSSAGSTQVCQNSSLQLATCSSSLRYKTNIAPLSTGLSFIRQLRPISFDWKAGGMHDIGFGAEDVAKINPLFVTYNKEGQVEGVKYDRFSTVFVNAFKEQQTQIEQQGELIRKQQMQIDGLKNLVCADHPNAEVCKQ